MNSAYYTPYKGDYFGSLLFVLPFYRGSGEEGAHMHDECKVFAKALENATKAVEATNEVNRRLFKLYIFTVIMIIFAFLARDYIQYTASYDYPTKTATTEKGGQQNVYMVKYKKHIQQATETTKATKTTKTT